MFQLEWQILAEEANQEVAAELLCTGLELLNVLMDGLLIVERVKNVVARRLWNRWALYWVFLRRTSFFAFMMKWRLRQ